MPLDLPPSPAATTLASRRATAWASAGIPVAIMMALAIIHPALMSWLIGASALVAGSVWWINRRRPDSGPAYALPETVGPTAQIADVELLEALFEALSDPVMVISGDEPADIADRRVVLANAAARELFRIPREGTLLISVLRDPQVLEAIDEALFGGVSRATEYFVRDRYWRASTGALTSGKSGRLGLVVLQDETDVRRMELMRVDFLANASHELRTPLASLSGFIETLKGHARDDEQARDRFLDIMTIQADRMSRLVADLLSLSRIELNEHVPPSGLVDLAGVCRDVMDAVSVLSDDRGIRVQLTEDDQRPAPVHGDRDEIIQVVQNLVDNATKYSPAGGVVEIAIRRDISLTEASAPWSGENRGDGATRLPLVTPGRVAGMHYMAVIVRDHGPGLAREHLPRLTERFYRVEGQKSGERAGTGLGLAIVKHIVNRHRGGLTVESAPGQGAKFTAYFPAAGDL